MAIYSGMFNSVNDDRKYNAWWFAKYFSTFIENGVFPNPSVNLQVVENEDMTTTVKTGTGWINGYFIYSDSDHVLEHDLADGVLKRIDRIVMRLDYLERQIDIVIKKGTFASNPVAPTLQRDADAYELALADVLINNGATQIIQGNITDLRLNNELCGIVHGVVGQVDTTTLFNQYQSWFEEMSIEKTQEFDSWQAQEQVDFEVWLESIKDLLDGDVAGNLAAQITDLVDELKNHELKENVHSIGDKTLLATKDKESIVEAINSHVHDYIKHPAYATATGTNAYTVTLDPAPTELIEGMRLVLKITNSSTANCTLNVNNLGVKNIMNVDGSPANNLKANSIYTLRYNGVNFILQAEGGDRARRVANNLLGAGLRGEVTRFSDDDFLYTTERYTSGGH